jgi:hypothetical protein
VLKLPVLAQVTFKDNFAVIANQNKSERAVEPREPDERRDSTISRARPPATFR